MVPKIVRDSIHKWVPLHIWGYKFYDFNIANICFDHTFMEPLYITTIFIEKAIFIQKSKNLINIGLAEVLQRNHALVSKIKTKT